MVEILHIIWALLTAVTTNVHAGQQFSFGEDKIYLANTVDGGEQGGALPVLVDLQNLMLDSEWIFRWRIYRHDPLETGFTRIEGTVLRVFLERSQNGQDFESVLVTQFRIDSNFLNPLAEKQFEWPDDLADRLSELSISPSAELDLKQEIEALFRLKKTFRLCFFPKPLFWIEDFSELQTYIRTRSAPEVPRSTLRKQITTPLLVDSRTVTDTFTPGVLLGSLVPAAAAALTQAADSTVLSPGSVWLFGTAIGIALSPSLHLLKSSSPLRKFQVGIGLSALGGTASLCAALLLKSH